MKVFYFILLCILIGNNNFAQKVATISGEISGVDTLKIYLGNKSFLYGNKTKIFDSVKSKNGRFQFKNFEFSEVDFYSIHLERSAQVFIFLIDTGKIVIVGKKDSMYLAKISGSKENDFFKEYSLNVLGPYIQIHKQYSDSAFKYKNKNSTLFELYSEKLKKGKAELVLAQENFIQQHHGSFTSLIALSDLEDEISTDSLRYYFNLLDTPLKEHSRAKPIIKSMFPL
jgi:Domain of unknown function (DUF4369)